MYWNQKNINLQISVLDSKIFQQEFRFSSSFNIINELRYKCRSFSKRFKPLISFQFTLSDYWGPLIRKGDPNARLFLEKK